MFALIILFTITDFSQASEKYYQEIVEQQDYILPDFLFPFQTKSSENWSKENSLKFYEDDLHLDNIPIVPTDFGVLYGITHPESHAFYSIPYAMPPVEAMRFEAPIRFLQNSSTIVNASIRNQIACQQNIKPCDNGVCVDKVSEDCLVLNVFVPSSVQLDEEIQPEANLPVMVFFHGGYFYAGSGTTFLFDGKGLSNHTNTIVVTVNYRLGPFGFIYYNDGSESIEGNQGLKDQQLALTWVQENIKKFGGNENMVTIFGESAGAQSVMFHLISNESAPFFNRAILQSNPALISYNTKNQSRIVTEALMDAVNCSTYTIECLRNTDAGDLVDALEKVVVDAIARGSRDDVAEPFRPHIDGMEFKDQPLVHFDLGWWNTDKEVMMGVNSEELAYVEEFKITQNMFDKINDFGFGSVGNNVTVKYEELAKNTKYEDDYPAILGVEGSDAFFVCPTRALARFISKTSQTGHLYLYNNTYPMSGPSCIEVVEPDLICGRSFHTAELVFVFRSGSEYGYNFSEADTVTADLFSRYWGNFAYFGEPDPTEGTWTKYESDGLIHPNFVIKATDSDMSDNYRGTICDFWDTTGVYPSPTEEITTSSSVEFVSYTSTEPSQAENTTSGAKTLGFHDIFLFVCFVIIASVADLF